MIPFFRPHAAGDGEILEQPVEVLFIGDNDVLAESYRLKLELDGYRVSMRPCRASAIHDARDLRPDVIYLDMVVPSRESFALLRAIRSEPVTRSTPIAILSADGGLALTRAGLDLGPLDYVIRATVAMPRFEGPGESWIQPA